MTLRSAMKRRSGGQALLPMVLILTGVLGLLGVTFASIAYLQSLLSSQRAFAEFAYQAAASGIDDGLLRLARDKDYLATMGYTLSVGTAPTVVVATVTITSTPGASGCSTMLTCRTINSEATYRRVVRTLEAVVEITGSGATRVLSQSESVL